MGTGETGSEGAWRFCLLVVEPDFQVRDIITSAFEDDPIDLIAVTGGREARAILRTRHVDFLLVELILRDGDGERLAEFAEKAGCGVALVSGHPEGIRRGEAGRWCFLRKPFSVLEVRRLVLAELASVAGRPSHA